MFFIRFFYFFFCFVTLDLERGARVRFLFVVFVEDRG
jgi:hypothetical protein